MKKHFADFWSLYMAFAAAVTPYLPYIHGAVNNFWASHATLTAKIMAGVVVIAHWLPSPGTPPTE